ncbi:MAG: glycosyltransferase family 4 protein [Gemmatimonadetes bacterium]|nr:glycosyltransferase family 4 protein [Gemmatimonadota bacterium]
MRIAYLSASVIPSHTANSIQVMRMCEAFADLGHDVELHAVQGADRGEDDHEHYGTERAYTIVKHPRPRLRLVGAAAYALAAARSLRARANRLDLVYGRAIYALSMVAGAGVPLMYEAHAPPPHRAARRTQAALFARPSFLRLVVISDALRREYLRLFPTLSPEKIVVAHDAADPSIASASSAPVRLAGDTPVGYIGSLYPGRGVEIIAALAARMPEVDFHVIGGGREEVAACRARYDRPNLHFHGFVAPRRVPDYLSGFAVVLAPYQERVAVAGGRGDTSRWMSPLKLFEYMAAAKCLLCSDLPVLREVLRDGENSLLIPPTDVAAWERALRRVLADAQLRAALGRTAREQVAAGLTWRHRAERVLG